MYNFSLDHKILETKADQAWQEAWSPEDVGPGHCSGLEHGINPEDIGYGERRLLVGPAG